MPKTLYLSLLNVIYLDPRLSRSAWILILPLNLAIPAPWRPSSASQGDGHLPWHRGSSGPPAREAAEENEQAKSSGGGEAARERKIRTSREARTHFQDRVTGSQQLPSQGMLVSNSVKYMLGYVCDFFPPWPHRAACGILVPRPGIEPTLPELEVRSLDHWTAREVPVQYVILKEIFKPC